MTPTETGHGSPGGGTAGVSGAGAGDSSAGHGSPGAGTADLAQDEGYGAPGAGTADESGAGSAGPESTAMTEPGYGAGTDAPYDQTADDAAYGGTGYGSGGTDQRPVEPAATGEHWTPPGADVGDSAPGAPAGGSYAAGTGYPAGTDQDYTAGTGQDYTAGTDQDYAAAAEPADGSYEVPADEAYTAGRAEVAREEGYRTDEGYAGNTEAANDVSPEAYPGGGTTTTEETGAATAWDSGTTAEPYADEVATTPEDQQRWEDTHAGGAGAGVAGGAAGAAVAGGAAVGGATGADDDQDAWATEDTGTGEPYTGPMDDTSGHAGEQVGLAPEGQPGADAAAVGAAGAAAPDQPGRYEQDALLGEPAATDRGGDAGDYGYDEAHYGATSSGGYAPGAYGPGSATPAEDGSGPAGWSVKGNAGSMLFHTPDSPSYDAMAAEVWFESEEAARAAGFAHWDRKQR